MKPGFKLCLPFFLFFILLTWWVSPNVFFWDTLLQASKQAHFYYEHRFSSLILPLELDAGHPPLFAIYLAFVWMLLGKSLALSHWAMLPLLFGIVWQLYRLISCFIADRLVFWGMVVVICNVTFLGQSSLVSPDIALLFAFLLAVNGIFYKKKWQIIAGTIIMSLLSIRGIFLISALFIFRLYDYWLQQEKRSLRTLFKLSGTFIPVALVASSYYLFHFWETGWLLSTPNEAWTTHREMVSLGGLIKKIAVLGWRLLDYGMVSVWLVFGILGLMWWKRREKIDLKTKQLFGLPLVILLTYLPVFLFLNNPIAHRYLMPAMLLFTIAVYHLVIEWVNARKWWPILFGFIFLTQLGGHFWVYPRHIAQGWDSTLAHLPYYELRRNMVDYLDGQEIALNHVGTEFPMIGPSKYLDLSDRESGFKEKDMQKDRYIVYCNVFNDFSDTELVQLETDFKTVKTFEKGQIEMILLERK